jgi:flagellar hook-associated protein 1 FlgK
LIDLRDKILPDLQSGLDELTSKLQGSVNRIHNRGIAFPGLGAFSGTTAFATPAVSEISLAAGDVALLQFDANGEEVAGTTLNTLMTAVPLAANGPWTIDEVVSAIDGWLGANGVAALDADGKLQITMTAGGGRTLAFRDQASATRGSAFQDARIQFDTDADGTPEQTVDGFSFFFGLNDFFVDQATGTAGVAETVAVRADLVAAPNLVSRGRVQWDPTRNVTGRYHVSTGEGSIATDMAQALAADDTFDAAGGLAQIRTTYADYGSLIVGLSADLAQANESQAGFQGELVTALRHKSDTVRGVNIDEELSDLILYEQAYSAAARVITSIQQMFEALERSMG